MEARDAKVMPNSDGSIHSIKGN